MKTRIVIITACISCMFYTQNQAQRITEVSGFQNPESVVAHKNHLYVSNMGEQPNPMAKDGDGYISLLSRDGKVIEQKFITGLNSPKGLLIKHRMLFVADVDKILCFSMKTKKKLWEADLSKMGVMYANDIAKKGCFSILISATDKNAIYKVCANGKVKQLKVKGNIEGVNGLSHKLWGSRLFVANYGRGNEPQGGGFGKICMSSKKYKPYQNDGIYDGIIRIHGRLVLSDWVSNTENRGRLVVYRICKKKMTEVSLGRLIGGPSDIYYDCKTKKIWIPAMRENKLLSISVNEIKKL